MPVSATAAATRSPEDEETEYRQGAGGELHYIGVGGDEADLKGRGEL